MHRFSILSAVLFSTCVLLFAGCQYSSSRENPPANIFLKASEPLDTNRIVLTENEWKTILSPQQFACLRNKETERPFTGKYCSSREKGIYVCAACGNELFASEMKYDAECGWPSFDNELKGGKTVTALDTTYEMVRTEVLCRRCGSHLGHLFYDGPTETGLHYCINSTSLDFKRELSASR